MTISIQETCVTPTASGLSVRLHISEAPIDAVDASFRLSLLASIPTPETQILQVVQRAAIAEAIQALTQMYDQLYADIPARAQSLAR